MAGSNFDVEIAGLSDPFPIAGTDYDQLNVTGTVTINSTANLNLFDNLAGDNNATIGDRLVLINNDSDDAVLGHFGPLFLDGVQVTTGDLADNEVNNGDAFTFDGDTWRIFYDGGDGNDMVMVMVSADAPVIYVNDDFTGANGTLILDADANTAGDQAAIIGVNAFDTIQEAVDAVDDGGTVAITDDINGPTMSPNAVAANDGPGMYVENVVINKNVTVQSTEGDAAAVIVDGNDAGSVFTIGSTFAVSLDSLTIQNGSASEGAGINNQGDLTVTGSIIQNNTASSNGGRIFNNTGSVTIQSGSMITTNTTAGSGGGIYNEAGTLTVDNSTIGGNTASGTSGTNGGGGVFNNTGTVTIRGGSMITSNSVANVGGGILNQGTLTVNASTIGSNTAAAGGGIANNSLGTATIEGGTTITGNSAAGDFPIEGGGGIFNDGSMTVNGSTVANNTAMNGAGIFNSMDATLTIEAGSTILGNTAAADGGGIYNDAGTVSVSSADVLNNTANLSGGGLWNGTGTMTIDGVTIDGNTASGDGAADGGGGIFNNGGSVSLSSTVNVTNNIADGDQGSGGGIFNHTGGTITANGTTITGNTANRAGGGIEDNSGAGLGIMLTNVTLDNNVATRRRGDGFPRQRRRSARHRSGRHLHHRRNDQRQQRGGRRRRALERHRHDDHCWRHHRWQHRQWQ